MGVVKRAGDGFGVLRIVDVADTWVFAGKVGGVAALMNLVGMGDLLARDAGCGCSRGGGGIASRWTRCTVAETNNLVGPIKTKADYDRALARIDELMSAKLGTPEGDELDALATLLDAYESEHFPMDAPDPLANIEFQRDQQG